MTTAISATEDPMYCCDTFEAALQSGTDNEGHGRMVRRHPDGGYEVGCGLPAIMFCPWCCTNLSKKHPIEVAARAVVDSRYSGGNWEDLSEAIGNLGYVLDKQSEAKT